MSDTGTVPRQRPDPPVDSPSILLLTMARRIEAALDTNLRPLGLSVSRLALLGHVAALPGASFSELARVSGVTVQSVHTGVRALVADGLVRDGMARAGTPSVIELTARGRSRLKKAMAVVAALDTEYFGAGADEGARGVGEALRSAVQSVSRD